MAAYLPRTVEYHASASLTTCIPLRWRRWSAWRRKPMASDSALAFLASCGSWASSLGTRTTNSVAVMKAIIFSASTRGALEV